MWQTPNTILMYLEILVNRKSIMIIVNISATYKFILVEEIMRFGLTLEKEELYMKVVNSIIKLIREIVQILTMKFKC